MSTNTSTVSTFHFVLFATVETAIGPAKTFWIYGGISLLSFIFVLVLIPETKGRTLEQIEKMWTHAKPLSRA
jgi:MFS transporter, SP family, arabinose:H+ symporter